MRLVNKLLGLSQHDKKCSVARTAPALSWHPVHGDNISLSEDSGSASRRQSFAQSLVFSDRPLMRGERVWLRLSSVSSVAWRGGLRLGVTSGAPSTWQRPSLPRYLCPDMTRDRRGRTWARALPEKYCSQGNVIFIQVRSSGDLIWGVNGKEKGVLVSGVETATPVWAVVDVYGSISSVELVDPRRSLTDIMNDQEIKETKENKKETGERKVIHNQDILRQRMQMTRAVLSQECHGQNVRLSSDGEVAKRTETEFSHGYVFLDSIMNPEETLIIRILETDSSYVGSLAFGLTSADPRFLKSSELPEDSDILSQRPEYWVSSKDVLPDPQDGDEVSLTVSLDGAVLCSVNGGPQRVLFHTDISLNTRPFIDIYGVAQKIQVLGVSPSQPTVTLRRSSRSNSSVTRPKSCSPDANTSLATTECVVCYESEVDCVLYSCGHMCMCFQCAVHQWSQAGECPLCRQAIRDVIRTYRA